MSHADLSDRQRRAARVRLAELIAVRRSQRDRDRERDRVVVRPPRRA